jgi:hypothetical protein
MKAILEPMLPPVAQSLRKYSTTRGKRSQSLLYFAFPSPFVGDRSPICGTRLAIFEVFLIYGSGSYFGDIIPIIIAIVTGFE